MGFEKRKNSTQLIFSIKAILISILLLYGILWWRLSERISSGLVDFVTYYTTGKILISGYGNELYDLKLQSQVQQALLKQYMFEDGVLAYIHPPFQALVFVPFSYLPFSVAYFAWSAFMFILGMVSIALLLKLPNYRALRPWSIHVFLATFCFFPVFISLIQGQDSLMLLFFITWAFTLMKKGKETWAGIVLALALFKFHLLLPLYALFVVKKKWKVISGSICSALCLAVLSYVAVGIHGMIRYGKLLLEMVHWTNKYNFRPLEMRNLRGMLALLLGDQRQIISVASLILSGVVLALVLMSGRGLSIKAEERFDFQFSLSLIAGLLVGYYLYVHDQSILVLPMIVLSHVAQAEKCLLRKWIIFLILAANPSILLPITRIRGCPIPINVIYLILLFGSFFHLACRRSKHEETKGLTPMAIS
jgi:Glycosyltransferase family 87